LEYYRSIGAARRARRCSRQLPILLGEIFGIADDGMIDAKKAKEPLSGYVGFRHISDA
jgi:hypothetical protein